MGSFSCKLNLFSYESFYTKTRFENEAQGVSEMAHCHELSILYLLRDRLVAEDQLEGLGARDQRSGVLLIILRIREVLKVLNEDTFQFEKFKGFK